MLVVQGMVFHNMNSLNENEASGSNLDLYFHGVDEVSPTSGIRSTHLDAELVIRILDLLRCNPYGRFFMNLRQYSPLSSYTIVLRSTPALDQHTFNLPTVSQVGAVWSKTTDVESPITRDIRVYVNENTSYLIQYYYACYDPLQYPLLFPRGEPGWHAKIQKHGHRTIHPQEGLCAFDTGEATALVSAHLADSAETLLQNEAEVLEDGETSRSGISIRQYYCYLFQMRPFDKSYLLHFGRLMQQFCIDMYIKLETQRLDYYRSEQCQLAIRAKTLQGIVDSMSIDGHTNPSVIGRRYVLPSSFIGGPKDMWQRYVNTMALVKEFGKPDLFITMTCNPSWPEIPDRLIKHERADDRPDLVVRMFKAKLDELKDDMIKKKLFGDVPAYVYNVEFQKWGLPHVHCLLILRRGQKIESADMFDRVISAEIPKASAHPILRSFVVKHMMHEPCGKLKPKNVCMQGGNCKNHYPKKYQNITTVGADSYPLYRRRNDGDSVRVRGVSLDNQWVVPYNPYLLAKFDCHINVEICCDIKIVKYLYKYIYKGHDRVSFQFVREGEGLEYNEIIAFQSGRWVAAPEALWRIYGFPLSEAYPSVIILPVHLENHQIVRFGREVPLSSIVEDPASHQNKLTKFFRMNAFDTKARSLNLLYREFPRFYVWNSGSHTWSTRCRGDVIGRLVTVHPTEGECFYERILLNNVRAPPSMRALRTVAGVEYQTFREAAFKLGLLDSDSYIVECLEEAVSQDMPASLRRLFATILAYCWPTDPVSLWSTFKEYLCHDYVYQERLNQPEAEVRALVSVQYTLQSMGKSINEYSLVPNSVRLTEEQKFQGEIEREKSIILSKEDLEAESLLNCDQKEVFTSVVSSLNTVGGGAFFVDGPGGSGKTFLYRAILAYVRQKGDIALAVATSGVAASLLPSGRTAHSRFKFPLETDDASESQVSKQSSLGRLIKMCKLIVWDEVTMANKCIIESLDRLLRDLCDSDLCFGGKVVLFGGDFRQTLPIVVGASCDDTVGASFVSSTLWPHLKKFRLHRNMRARGDAAFTEFLLSVGNGLYPYVNEDFISLPAHMRIPFEDTETSLKKLITYVYPSLTTELGTSYSIVHRAILTPKNNMVDEINAILIQEFPGQPMEYVSYDKADINQQSEYEDYLTSVSISGLPPHRLLLKIGCPVILLRNLDPFEGLCNGTRLIVRHLGERLIGADIAVGDYKGRHVFIPRIPLQSSDKSRCPIAFKRHQFPIRLCFAMIINKSQGQTLDIVGVYLEQPVFSHGQLYVALSRARSFSHVKVLVRPRSSSGYPTTEGFTKNVVYPEIFELAIRNG